MLLEPTRPLASGHERRAVLALKGPGLRTPGWSRGLCQHPGRGGGLMGGASPAPPAPADTPTRGPPGLWAPGDAATVMWAVGAGLELESPQTHPGARVQAVSSCFLLRRSGRWGPGPKPPGVAPRPCSRGHVVVTDDAHGAPCVGRTLWALEPTDLPGLALHWEGTDRNPGRRLPRCGTEQCPGLQP